jgi:hypothetical protein
VPSIVHVALAWGIEGAGTELGDPDVIYTLFGKRRAHARPEAWKRIAGKIVLAEDAEKNFVGSAPPSALDMLDVVRVKLREQETLPAITHQDGTGPLQTVFREQSPRYDHLIGRFGQVTGMPVVLNIPIILVQIEG